MEPGEIEVPGMLRLCSEKGFLRVDVLVVLKSRHLWEGHASDISCQAYLGRVCDVVPATSSCLLVSHVYPAKHE